MKKLFTIAAVAFSLSFSGAMAQPKEDRPQAEQALKDGIKAYKDGHYEEALAYYKKAAELAPSASGPFREMGKVYEALGREEDAKFAYQEYLRRKPDASDADEIKARLSAIEGRKPSKGSIFLPTAVAGIEIWVDGKLSATTPMTAPLALPSGSYKIELREGSTVISKESITLASGEAKLLTSPEARADKVDPGSNKKRPAWIWVAGGATLVGLGVGTAVAIDALESGGGGGDSGGGKNRGQGKRASSPFVFTVSF